MRTIGSGFRATKDLLTNTPIRLYIVEDGELDPGEVLRFAEWGENITFNSLVYYAAPVKFNNITENAAQEIDSGTIEFGNVDRSFVHYLESHDGLRGCKVTVRMVFRETLADATAYSDDIMYVASSSMVGNKSAVFNVKSKMDLFNVELPLRRFYRSTCQWGFTSTECGYAGVLTTCGHNKEQCATRANLTRLGAFPGAGTAVRRLYVG